jgi:hypothetical protein
MSTISDRIKLYNYYIRVLDTDTYMKKIFNKIGLLGEGGQGKVYKYCDKECSGKELAIKKMYLDKKQSKYVDDIFNVKSFTQGVFIELSSFYLINEIILQNISPNFILNYDYEFIERKNGICNDLYPYTGYFYNEYIESETYTEWVKKNHSIELWYNAYFQITTAIYTLQKYFNMTHLDLHSDNILVKKVKLSGYWSYIINGITYKVPNLGYIFYINDFGHAFIPKVFKSWFARQRYSAKTIHKGFDINDLFKSTLKISTSSIKFKKEIRFIIKKLKNNHDFNEIINKIWSSMYETNNNPHNIEIYNLDKNMSTKRIPKELKHLCIN